MTLSRNLRIIALFLLTCLILLLIWTVSEAKVPVIKTCDLAPLKSLDDLKREGFTQSLGEVYNKVGKSIAHANVFWVKQGPPRPVILFNHGAGGQPPGFTQSTHRLLSEGFALVAPGHSPVSGAIFPQYLSDIRCAVRWTRANAARFNLDPDRIIVTGFSMGGWLSALVGVTADRSEFDGNCTTSSQVSASVLGVVATAAMYDFAQPPLPSKDLFNFIFGEEASLAQLAAASAVNYVNDKTPPYVIIQGTQDPIVPARQADHMAKALQSAGVPFALLKVEEGHAPRGDLVVLYEGGNPMLLCTVLNFLKTLAGLR